MRAISVVRQGNIAKAVLSTCYQPSPAQPGGLANRGCGGLQLGTTHGPAFQSSHLQADRLDAQQAQALEQRLAQPRLRRLFAHDDRTQLAVVAHQDHLRAGRRRGRAEGGGGEQWERRRE